MSSVFREKIIYFLWGGGGLKNMVFEPKYGLVILFLTLKNLFF
jgi:hypothetical protein